jgi:hypothetical protein
MAFFIWACFTCGGIDYYSPISWSRQLVSWRIDNDERRSQSVVKATISRGYYCVYL